MVRTVEDVDQNIIRALGAGDIELYRILLEEKELLLGMIVRLYLPNGSSL